MFAGTLNVPGPDNAGDVARFCPIFNSGLYDVQKIAKSGSTHQRSCAGQRVAQAGGRADAAGRGVFA